MNMERIKKAAAYIAIFACALALIYYGIMAANAIADTDWLWKR